MTRRSPLSIIAFLCLGAAALTPASAGAAQAGDRTSEQAVTRVVYPDNGIEVARLSGDERRLSGASRSFKRFVAARLDVLFADAGSKRRCATSPTISVDRYDSSGWARAGEGWYDPCPAGGYAVIYQRTPAGWQQILGTQEARFCQDLSFYGVPRFIGGRRCAEEDFTQVRYRRGGPSASPEATARRVASIASGLPIVPEEHVITAAARAQLQGYLDKSAYLAVEDCVTAAEGGPLAVHLGTAPYGCSATATYPQGRADEVVLRMQPQAQDVLVTEIVPAT